tara:strand:+ start:71551 stop:72522 length:972 start_codon:yes stop_codon:yes gene_type:complete
VPKEHPESRLDLEAFEILRKRLGIDYVVTRLERQQSHRPSWLQRGRKLFPWKRLFLRLHFIKALLRILGIYGWGHRNYLDIRLEEHQVVLPSLPRAFEGYRILQLTDLHIDLDEDLVGVLCERLQGLDYDLCVMTGDYRTSSVSRGTYKKSIERMKPILACLKKPVYAILGNHDWLQMVLPLEALGMQFLINESVSVEKNGESLYIVGVDDPRLYGLHDLKKARKTIPKDACALLLSHTPATYQEAYDEGYALLLAGHTHGGQICLPGGRVVLNNDVSPYFMARGAWSYESLKGYTSRGVGACGIPVRYFCPPEITIHTLKSG